MDHTIIHFEIPADDLDRLKSFYEKALGWKIIKAPMEGMDYWIIQTVPTDEKGMLQGPGVNGGIFQKMPEQANATPVNYISVEDVDTYTTRVTKEGGRVLMQKQHIPKVGWIAIVEDPEGNPFGLITPSME